MMQLNVLTIFFIFFYFVVVLVDFSVDCFVMFRVEPIFVCVIIFLSFLIVTNFEIHTLIVDVCVCLNSAVIQYINLCILCLQLLHNI